MTATPHEPARDAAAGARSGDRPPVVDPQAPGATGRVLDALAAGLVVGLPTDTVYGLAARIDRSEALAAIFRAKGRPPGLALPVLVGRWHQAREVAAAWPRPASMLAARFWPGALTVVVPVHPALGSQLGGGGATVGLREPDHKLVRALCRSAGPLAVTSANVHGEPPCTTAEDLQAVFEASDVAVVVDGGRCDGEPSTVVDCISSPPTCLRHGAVPWAWIEASLR